MGNLIMLFITRGLTNVAKLGSREFEPRRLPGRLALEESSFLSSSCRTSEPLSGSRNIFKTLLETCSHFQFSREDGHATFEASGMIATPDRERLSF